MEQNTPEWLEFRRNKIGASDAPAIMGESPWDTPYQLWEKKIYNKPAEQNRAMARGTALEPAARSVFEKMTGLHVMPKVMVHPERDWQMASLDGITFDGSIIVEIKCPTNMDIHEIAVNGKIPDHYKSQVQHQLIVSGALKAIYFSFDGEKGVIVETSIEADRASMIIEKEEAFYKCMQTLEPPKMMEKDYAIREDFEWNLIADEWMQIGKSLKDIEEREEILRKKLIAMAGDHNTIGGGIQMTRFPSKGRVDYDAIPELKGINLDQYRKPACQKWRISACKPKDLNDTT